MAQNILITGASSGIGKALAVELAKNGNRLVLCARRANELNAVATECLAKGAKEVSVVPGDLGGSGEPLRIVSAAEKAFDGLDVVIANAGISKHATAEHLQLSDVENIFKVNFHGAVATVLAALPAMLKKKSGQIIGVSSIAGFRGMPGSAAYCASKAAFTTFLESLRPELKHHGIHLSVVMPGFIATPLTAKNKFPMPFLMSAEKSAKIIVRGMATHKPNIAFPLPTVALMRFLQILPARVFDLIMARLPYEAPNTESRQGAV